MDESGGVLTVAGGMLKGGDGVTITNIPGGLDVYAGYTGGSWPTYEPLVKLTPKKLHLAYAINAWSWGDCLDDEPGDATPEQVEGWMDNIWKPVNTLKPAAYTSASAMGPMLLGITRPRSTYLTISAHYTNTPHICSSVLCWPSSPIAWTADATQWSDNNGKWDSLLFEDYFFTALPAPPAPAPLEDHPMGFILASTNVPTVWIVQGVVIKLPDTTAVAAVEQLGVTVYNVPPELITAALAAT